MSPERLRATVLCSVFFLTLVGMCVGVPEEGTHAPPSPPRNPAHAPEDDQEKYGGGEGGEVGHVGGQLGTGRGGPGAPMSPEMVPQAMPLRNPTSLNKRLYPRWYQTYMYKSPSYNHVASPVGEHKRFQPFHPLARFRGLALGGASSPSSGYRSYDQSLADHPGHRLPTAPNAQPSHKYESSPLEEEEEEEEEEKPVRVGELLHLLREIAGDRGLSGHTKSFRFGISRRK